MKRWILLAAGAGAAAAAAALLWQARASSAAKPSSEEAAKAAASGHGGSRQLGAQALGGVQALIADGSPEAWGQLAALYPRSDAATKRSMLQQIAQLPELRRVIGYLLATVGEDPTPASADPMVEEAAALLKERWKTPQDFDYGRRTMVMQQTDKRRWLLANALISFARDVGEDSPFHALKSSLGAKLIDLHSEIEDGYIKSSVVDGVHALGGKDAALILAKGLAVKDEELESVTEQEAAAHEVLRRSVAR